MLLVAKNQTSHNSAKQNNSTGSNSNNGGNTSSGINTSNEKERERDREVAWGCPPEDLVLAMTQLAMLYMTVIPLYQNTQHMKNSYRNLIVKFMGVLCVNMRDIDSCNSSSSNSTSSIVSNKLNKTSQLTANKSNQNFLTSTSATELSANSSNSHSTSSRDINRLLAHYSECCLRKLLSFYSYFTTDNSYSFSLANTIYKNKINHGSTSSRENKKESSSGSGEESEENFIVMLLQVVIKNNTSSNSSDSNSNSNNNNLNNSSTSNSTSMSENDREVSLLLWRLLSSFCGIFSKESIINALNRISTTTATTTDDVYVTSYTSNNDNNHYNNSNVSNNILVSIVKYDLLSCLFIRAGGQWQDSAGDRVATLLLLSWCISMSTSQQNTTTTTTNKQQDGQEVKDEGDESHKKSKSILLQTFLQLSDCQKSSFRLAVEIISVQLSKHDRVLLKNVF